jgi:hypothetical protein
MKGYYDSPVETVSLSGARAADRAEVGQWWRRRSLRRRNQQQDDEPRRTTASSRHQLSALPVDGTPRSSSPSSRARPVAQDQGLDIIDAPASRRISRTAWAIEARDRRLPEGDRPRKEEIARSTPTTETTAVRGRLELRREGPGTRVQDRIGWPKPSRRQSEAKA